LQFQAIATLADGTTREVTNEAIWSNQPGAAGTINNSGFFITSDAVTGVETIRADYRGQSVKSEIRVTFRAINLTIWPVAATVEAGKTIQFEAFAVDQGEDRNLVTAQVSWSLIPGAAATIDQTGLLRATPGRSGQETVIGKYQNLTAQSRAQVQNTFASQFEMSTIPAGTFQMGDSLGRDDEKPAHEVLIDAFQIGRYEVTNAQYAAYLNQAFAAREINVASGGVIFGDRGPFARLTYARLNGSAAFPDEFIEQVQNEFRVKPGFEQYPVVRVTWYGAAAFCAFYGLRLPTEAEWEKACRGGQQFAYGTQDGSLNHDLANYAGQGGRDTFAGLAPIKSFPPNPFGLYDLCGNAAEFVFDVYGGFFYSDTLLRANNPIGPGPTRPIGRLPLSPGAGCSLTIHRGGSWINEPFSCRSAVRAPICDIPIHALLEQAVVGFRVARSLP